MTLRFEFHAKKKRLSPAEMFQTAQSPVMWLDSANRLRDAAEIILADQVKQEVPYFQAVDAASVEAELRAQNAPDGSATADIPCQPPNYLPAQLLYAFAIENAFKGLIVARNPDWISPQKLSKDITSHDLIALAKSAGFCVEAQEVPVLKALSLISVWIGRYPVAITQDKFVSNPYPPHDPDALLDGGSQHPIMRVCCDRALRELEKTLPGPPFRFGVVVAFAP
jgi:hypothetical protein